MSTVFSLRAVALLVSSCIALPTFAVAPADRPPDERGDVRPTLGECSAVPDCDDGDPCTFDLCVDGACSNEPARFGDIAAGGNIESIECGPNESIDIRDVFQVVNAFAGRFSAPCVLENIDISGPGRACMGDGVIDLHDLSAVLRAFTGADECCIDCLASCDDGLFCSGVEVCDERCLPGENPCPDQVCVEAATECIEVVADIVCRSPFGFAISGDTVTVEFFISDVRNLSGYQLAIDVSRTSGEGDSALALVDGRVDLEREDYVFGSASTPQAVDVDGMRVVSALVSADPGIDVGEEERYLVTLEFEVDNTTELGSTFEIGLVPDPGTFLLHPGAFTMPYASQPCELTILPADCQPNELLDDCDIDCGPKGGKCDVKGCGLSVDCNLNEIPDECDLERGVSEDCNENDVPDECDLDELTSPDCNENDVPDECDISSEHSLDCNANGTPDECDLADGTSTDCDENMNPDECDILNCGKVIVCDCDLSGVHDACELLDGTLHDLNDNGTPDECEGDCDGDGVPDFIEIKFGEPDCQMNGIPDECEPDFDGDGIVDECDPDMDDDGVANEADVCGMTPPGAAVDSEGRPLGDIDRNCYTDLIDFDLFQQGFTGPPPSSP